MCMQIDDEHYVLCLYKLRQTKRKRRKMCTKQYQNGIDIISSNLHEYLTSILHNLIQQLLWNTWILFLRFQSIYRILCFTMHRKQWEQYVKCQTIEIDPYFHIGLNIKLWYPCNSTALSVLQYSRLINILSEIFWSCVDKLVLNL